MVKLLSTSKECRDIEGQEGKGQEKSPGQILPDPSQQTIKPSKTNLNKLKGTQGPGGRQGIQIKDLEKGISYPSSTQCCSRRIISPMVQA